MLVRPGCALLVCILVQLGCSRESKMPPASVAAAKSLAVPKVAVAEARREALANELSVTAEFRAYQEIDVMAKVSGYLKKVEVDVGDRVSQGQLLATIEIPEMHDDLTRLTANIERSQAELARAKSELERAITAHEIAHLSHTRLSEVMSKRPGLVAQQELDTVRNRDLIAESQISSARSNLLSSEQSVKINEAEAARAKVLYGHSRVTAPFSGTVTKRFLDTGAMIQAGTSSHTQALPVVRLSDTRNLRLILPVPESAVPRLRLGARIEVAVESLGRSFQGRIARFSGAIQTTTRTMETEVDVPNPQGILVPGMYASARLKLEEISSALSVPVHAVDTGGEGNSVLVVTPGNTIELRRVRTGIETPERIEISEGLKEGELVVIGSRSQLREGQRVDPRRTEGPPKLASVRGSA